MASAAFHETILKRRPWEYTSPRSSLSFHLRVALRTGALSVATVFRVAVGISGGTADDGSCRTSYDGATHRTHGGVTSGVGARRAGSHAQDQGRNNAAKSNRVFILLRGYSP